MTDEDIKKMGGEFERFLNPVYGQLDRMEKTQEEHTDKIDALTAEMHDVHQELGVFKDRIGTEIDKIKEHIDLPSGLPNSET